MERKGSQFIASTLSSFITAQKEINPNDIENDPNNMENDPNNMENDPSQLDWAESLATQHQGQDATVNNTVDNIIANNIPDDLSPQAQQGIKNLPPQIQEKITNLMNSFKDKPTPDYFSMAQEKNNMVRLEHIPSKADMKKPTPIDYWRDGSPSIPGPTDSECETCNDKGYVIKKDKDGKKIKVACPTCTTKKSSNNNRFVKLSNNEDSDFYFGGLQHPGYGNLTRFQKNNHLAQTNSRFIKLSQKYPDKKIDRKSLEEIDIPGLYMEQDGWPYKDPKEQKLDEGDVLGKNVFTEDMFSNSIEELQQRGKNTSCPYCGENDPVLAQIKKREPWGLWELQCQNCGNKYDIEIPPTLLMSYESDDSIDPEYNYESDGTIIQDTNSFENPLEDEDSNNYRNIYENLESQYDDKDVRDLKRRYRNK